MLEDIKLRWQSFIYNFRWDDYVRLLDGWIPKASVAVPILGYLILFNDSAAEHLTFDKLLGEGKTWLSAQNRLRCLYFGLILLAVANALYLKWRPHVLKFGRSQFEYVETALTHFTLHDFVQLHSEINSPSYVHTTVHAKYSTKEWEFFLAQARSPDLSRRDWNAVKSRYDTLLRSILIETYTKGITSRKGFLAASMASALTGYFLLMLPSLDVFRAVFYSTFIGP